jgi:hypothetical protein
MALFSYDILIVVVFVFISLYTHSYNMSGEESEEEEDSLLPALLQINIKIYFLQHSPLILLLSFGWYKTGVSLQVDI